jgi:hypothetical protein
MRKRWGTALVLALACAALAACGGGSPRAVGGPDLGVSIRLADCSDWKNGDAAERLGTIRELRDFAGGPSGSPAGHGNTLEDKRAYDLFQSWCGNYFARGFKLYKLYTRAAAFSPIQNP